MELALELLERGDILVVLCLVELVGQVLQVRLLGGLQFILELVRISARLADGGKERRSIPILFLAFQVMELLQIILQSFFCLLLLLIGSHDLVDLLDARLRLRLERSGLCGDILKSRQRAIQIATVLRFVCRRKLLLWLAGLP